MRIQSKIKNRKDLHSGVLPAIESRIESLAEQHDCSKSFVTNTLLAEMLNIKIEEHYYDYRKTNRKSKKSA